MKLTPFTLKSLRTPVALAMAAAIALTPATKSWADPNDIIGGPDAVKLNPDFNPDLGLIFDLDAVGDLFAGVGQVFAPTGFAFPQLGAALSQAISASNRPSVLTPYAGQLGGDPDAPVFDTLGSLVTNKATTIGKGNLGIGLSYQHSRFDEFDGHPIGKSVGFESGGSDRTEAFGLSDPIFGEAADLLVSRNDVLAVSNVIFTADVLTFSITYGLLDRLDVGALIPYIFLRTQGTANYQVTTRVDRVDPNTGEIIDTPQPTRVSKFKGGWDTDENGFGDIILFTKFQILSQAGIIGAEHSPAPLDLATQLEVKLPTGDENEFLGTGHTDVAIRLLAQRSIFENFLIRGEIGFNRSGIDNKFNTFEYKAGLEWQPLLAMAFSAEIIGTDSPEFESIIDGVIGAKYNFPRDLSVFAGLRFPLNDNGLRFDYAPIIGIEKTFQGPFSREADMASLPPRELPEFTPIEAPASPAPATAAGPAVPAVGEAPAPAPVAAPVPAQPAPVAAPASKSVLPPEYIIETKPANVKPTPDTGLPLPQGRNYGSETKGSPN